MIAKIVGIQTQDYKLDNGYAFKGIKVHAIDTMTMNSGLEGKEYTVYFNQKGAVDFITPYVPTK